MVSRFSILFFSIFLLSLSGCKEEAVSFNSFQGPDNQNQGSQPDEPIRMRPPRVTILKAATDHKIEEQTDVIFEVKAGDNPIEQVSCWVDGVELDCGDKGAPVILKGMNLGEHVFRVVAKDTEGLSDEAQNPWTIFDQYRPTQESLLIDGQKAKTDILFVVDNSYSMREEQQKISERFINFVRQIRGLNWHLGITTTDPRASEAWSDGRLHAFPDGSPFLTSEMDENVAEEQFSRHVRRRESGWDTEEGIRATFRSIERSITGIGPEDQVLRNFFRSDAALAVVLVSDEDESKNNFKNKGDNLLSYIRQEWGSEKVFQFNSIITHTERCLMGAGSSMGYAYEDLSIKTNGVVGDICANNYSSLLKNIGKGVADLHKSHNLKCVPQDKDGDGKVDLVISSLNGASIPGYTIDQNLITFDRFLKPGEYEFNYFCLAD